MIWATLICDASFHLPSKIGGWAAWIRVDGIPDPIAASGPLKQPVENSTTAEVYAALNGIWLARRNGAEAVLVRSDCMTVIELIEGRVKPSRPLAKAWAEAMSRQDMLGTVLRSQHVKGHGDIVCKATWVNDWADRHAKLEMRAAVYERNKRRYGNKYRKSHRSRSAGATCPSPSTGAPRGE